MNPDQIRRLMKAQDLIARAECLLEGVMEDLPTPRDAEDPVFNAVQDVQQAAYSLVVAVAALVK